MIASGLVLVGLGIAGVVRKLTERRRKPVMRFDRDAEGNAVWHRPTDHDDHGHDHGHGPRVAWLLAVPAILLLCLAPPPLGSFSANRDGTDAVVEQTGYTPLATPPAPGASGAAADPWAGVVTPMSLTEFIGRSHNPERSLEGRKVRLTGFVSPGAQPREWYLNRLVVSCCAADARRLRVLPISAPATGSWTGAWPSGPQTDAPSPRPPPGTSRAPGRW
ncbi:TIGR03943 family putative permease subunit [Kitasatospora aureofaciens]|uniref:TIGR03943 family putative permease subunit n=1 Tax=Kitasatospora aureofaciens TaxID=1894 RepID=UPI00068B530F|nr:TIGR03943 family protein [Kitasatospora aureofaciens]